MKQLKYKKSFKIIEKFNVFKLNKKNKVLDEYLDVLINDEYYDVLFEVIKHDRDNDLKILKNHKYKYIRNAVQEILKSKFQL